MKLQTLEWVAGRLAAATILDDDCKEVVTTGRDLIVRHTFEIEINGETHPVEVEVSFGAHFVSLNTPEGLSEDQVSRMVWEKYEDEITQISGGL